MTTMPSRTARPASVLAAHAASSKSDATGPALEGLPDNPRILCVSTAETHARIDAKVLRGLGLPQPRWMASGLEAARHLAAHGADLVFVDEECREMSGVEFVRLIRLHPALIGIPVVAVSTNGRSSAVLQAMAAGCSGFCVRPYAPDTLLRETRRALLRAPVLAPDILEAMEGEACSPAAFADKLATLESIQQEIQRVFSPRPASEARPKESCPAAEHRQLAKEWKELGRPDKVRHHLQEGARALARSGKVHDAWAMLEPLRQANPQVEPACAVAEACVREEELEVAAKLMVQTLRRIKRPALVYDAARRACCFTPMPKTTARQLADAMVHAGAGATAADIYLEIMHETEPASKKTASRRGLLASLPSLHDMVVVARHTVATYRRIKQNQAPESRELEYLG